MKHIGYEDAVLLLKEIVADRGEDWVYPNYNECRECYGLSRANAENTYCGWHNNDGCRYFTPEGQPACLVGEFIHRTLQPEEYERFPLEGITAPEAFKYLPLDVDERTLSLLLVAQQRQDTGHSWGDALSRAIHYVNVENEPA